MTDDTIVDRVAVRVRELEEKLDDFSDRLRAMRHRNRQVQEEIASFEEAIDELRSWLATEQGADS